MKSLKSKLLSLLLAMAMVLTMAPTALAANEFTVEQNGANPSVQKGSSIDLSASNVTVKNATSHEVVTDRKSVV